MPGWCTRSSVCSFRSTGSAATSPRAYIDGDYDVDLHQPTPDSLRVVELQNPSTALALRRVSDATALLREHRWAAAEAELERVLLDLGGSSVGALLDLDAVRRVGELARACRLWEEARHGEALERFRALGVEAPVPVLLLGELLGAGKKGRAKALRGSPTGALCHAADVWRQARRRTGDDPGDRYLRLFVAGELLLEALLLDMHRRSRVELVGAGIEDVVGLGGHASATLLATGGQPKGVNWLAELVGTEPLASARFWCDPASRGLRNERVHRMAVVEERHVEAASQALAILIPDVAALLDQLDAKAAALEAEVRGWLTTPGFEPPDVGGLLAAWHS